MAIKIKIESDNGIVTEYHRIAMIKIDINNQNTILVQSYISEEGRQIEKDYAAGKYNGEGLGNMKFPYVSARYISMDYDENMTIKTAYAYLKTLSEFSGAEDV